MKSILMTSSAVLLASGVFAAQAQETECPASIDAFTRDYEEVLAGAGADGALSASEQAELFGLRTTAENFHRAGNQEMCARAVERAQLLLETVVAPTALLPGELVGMDVRNVADEHLGEVEDVTIDPVSGRIAYVLIEHGGFLGIGDDLSAVPWRAVTYSPGSDHLLLDIDEERLEAAPRYDEGEMSAQQRRAWLLSVHSYYGVEPYWQDNFASLAMSGTAGQSSSEGASGQDAEQGADQSSEQSSGESTGTDTAAVVLAVPAEGTSAAGGSPSEGTDAASTDEVSRLTERLGELENRLETLSEQTAGGEVRQSLSSLEEKVQQLSESAPGDEMRQNIDELRAKVQQLSESAPGDETRQAVEELRTKVQQLSESAPGDEVRQTVASLETQVQELSRNVPEMRTMLEDMQSRLRQVAASAGASGAAFGAGSGSSQVAAPAGSQELAPPAAGSDAGMGQSGIDQSSTQSGTQSGGSDSKAVVRLPTADQPAAVIEVPADAKQAGQGGETASRTQQEGSGSQVIRSTVVVPSGSVGASDDGSASGEGDQAAADRSADRAERCEVRIERLEEDVARAGEAGHETQVARRELDAAEAMLERSEALCRAAIKRGREALAAAGFESTGSN